MKKYLLLSILITFLFSSFSITQAHATLLSTFDSGLEEWTVIGGAKNLAWNSSGGNPGGYISAQEAKMSKTWWFRSPDAWAGDWTPYIGGMISFDIIDIPQDQNDYEFGGHGAYYQYVDVVM